MRFLSIQEIDGDAGKDVARIDETKPGDNIVAVRSNTMCCKACATRGIQQEYEEITLLEKIIQI